jgi:lipopolysaccharide transport protein LptA
MNRLLVATGLVIFTLGPYSLAQDAASAAEPTAKPKTAPNPKAGTNPLAATENNGQPITTEIYADEASFNTEKRVGVFNGHVRVFDPRFLIQSDKLTVFIHKEEGEGLEKAIAEKNVGVVREKPDPKGGPPSKAIGLSEKAVYTSSDGNVVLTGTPRVQQGLDTHIATSPDTVMILNQDGQLTTHGPSRTEIRQDNTDNKTGKPDASPTPTPSPKKKKKKK